MKSACTSRASQPFVQMPRSFIQANMKTFICALSLFCMAQVFVSSQNRIIMPMPCQEPERNLKTGNIKCCRPGGPNSAPCSPGYTCYMHPAVWNAFCCPNMAMQLWQKPGTCMPLPVGTVGTCVQNCASDLNCPGNQKCCSNGCGLVCIAPIGG